MTQASPVDVVVNPNDTDQRYILWGNGRIDALGGAAPVLDNAQWYDRIDQPVAASLHITNWATGSGYTLTVNGSVHKFNGAPDIPGGVFAGVPYLAHEKRYIDWAWNPNGSGQGYVLDVYGQIYPFGGASAPPRTGARWTWPAAKKLAMRFTPDVRSVTLDVWGGIHGDFAMPSALAAGSAYWAGHNYARDFVVTDWSNAPSGYKLDLYGGVSKFGTAEGPVASTVPYRRGSDVARCLAVIDIDDPLAFWVVWSGGQSFDGISSTPPTVVAGGTDPVSPAATVTGTTRPVLSWTYSDPQKDSQAAWELLVFTQAFVSAHSMADPSVWAESALVNLSGINPDVRGVASPVDFANGPYRMYVRAQDTAGQWSAWSNKGWTQNIATPATPTGMTATPATGIPPVGGAFTAPPLQGPEDFAVDLSVSATTGGLANLIRFECSDDGETTWEPVRGADAVPLAATTTATDWDAPLGVTRSYRATAYAVDPAIASLPSATDTAIIDRRTYVLTAVSDTTLGGHVHVQTPVEWTRRASAEVFETLGSEYPTVVSDGTPKAGRTTLHVFTPNAAEAALVDDLIDADTTLVYRDPFGNVRYCRVVGDLPQALSKGAALSHMHTADLPLVQVRPPHLET